MRSGYYLRQHQQRPGGQAGQAGRAVNIRGQALGEQIPAILHHQYFQLLKLKSSRRIRNGQLTSLDQSLMTAQWARCPGLAWSASSPEVSIRSIDQ